MILQLRDGTVFGNGTSNTSIETEDMKVTSD